MGIVIKAYLLRWNIKGKRPQINHIDVVNTRNDEEQTRSLGTPGKEAAHSKDNSSLIFRYRLLKVKQM